MNKYLNLFGLSVVLFSIQVVAATTWDLDNNRVTYSVLQDGISVNGGSSSVNLSQLNLATVAQMEGVGTAANYVLTSVVLSMNGRIYGNLIFKNNGSTSVSPTYSFEYTSQLEYGAYSTPTETYQYSQDLGAIAPGATYSSPLSVAGGVTPQTVTIGDALQQFLGEGTIETVAYFSFVSTVIDNGGSSLRNSSSLLGEADVSVTYNYALVPEPTSMALVALGCAVLGLRRKRIFTV